MPLCQCFHEPSLQLGGVLRGFVVQVRYCEQMERRVRRGARKAEIHQDVRAERIGANLEFRTHGVLRTPEFSKTSPKLEMDRSNAKS
jgi:hypothetical protein